METQGLLQIEDRLRSSLDAAMRIRVSTITVARKSRNNNVREQQCKIIAYNVHICYRGVDLPGAITKACMCTHKLVKKVDVGIRSEHD